ncbi:VOC family protein [Natrialba asiatica]|uniref:Lactoylglutathione lyase family protein n=1 Tax=Natrialba asiatica (strain ATCC 700177 / DSM 12278 / JCM 9576 / FERM P-10747 / NBRC 102637 / 172P1) TaxID=29540 RepID=M0AVG2_NATA1|nr:VOC family protein [Natrialba asiatica]ELZ02676.1 lactoylglutathione lyase family protein [Natrialba asiatica DSM 12278]
MTHVLSWFEIPSTDFDRAVEFYSTVLDRDIDLYSPEEDDAEAPSGRAGMFDSDEGDVGGMIIETDEFTTDNGATITYTPTDTGLVVYLTVNGDLDDAIDRVESGGGDVLIPKEPIPEMSGHYAVITDSEGNRVGLISDE